MASPGKPAIHSYRSCVAFLFLPHKSPGIEVCPLSAYVLRYRWMVFPICVCTTNTVELCLTCCAPFLHARSLSLRMIRTSMWRKLWVPCVTVRLRLPVPMSFAVMTLRPWSFPPLDSSCRDRLWCFYCSGAVFSQPSSLGARRFVRVGISTITYKWGKIVQTIFYVYKPILL